MGKVKKSRTRASISKKDKLQHKSGLVDALLSDSQLKKPKAAAEQVSY